MKVLVVHTFNQSQKGNDSVVKDEIELLRSSGLIVELLSIPPALGSKLAVMRSTFFNYSSWRKVKKRISSFKPDLVHIHYLEYGSMASAVYAVKKCKLPLVFTPHNYSLLCPSETLFHQDKLYTESIRQPFPYKAIKEAFFHRSKALTFGLSVSMFLHHLLGTWKRFDSMIVSSAAIREVFVQSKLNFISGRLSINAASCSPCRAERHGPVQAPYYVYAGELTDKSGIPVLLESFADSGLTLKVAGRGALSKLINGYAEFYPNISLIETSDPNKISWLFENAAALVFPAVWYEPFGSMVIKALSMGLPVIASNLGMFSDVIKHGHNGLLFEAGNDRDLREKVDQFQSLTWSESKKYREHALQTYLLRFSPDRAAAQLTALYQSLCAQSDAKTILPDRERASVKTG